MIRRLALLALLFWGGRARAQAAVVVRVDDAGPGIGPTLLGRALALPHTLIPPAGERVVIARNSENRRTVIALGRDVVVEGKVQGDVIVVAGDLYMHPGASISGRAISIGGGVYESMVSSIGGGVTAFRDFTYDISPIPGGFSLRYRLLAPVTARALTWPGIVGFALPEYDRSNGLSLGVGPRYAVPGTHIAVAPRITYRSQLGKFDPFVVVTSDVDRRTTVRLRAGRTTESNDRWIRSDLVNSATFFGNGDDTRNYYRATGGDLTVHRLWESVNGRLAPYAGIRHERAASVRPGAEATGGPWTFFARQDLERDDRLRVNPPIDDGKRITSAIGGFAWEWADEGIVAHARTDVEAGSGFAQLTVDGRIVMPTFRAQVLRVDGHAVTSGGTVTPRQRYAYMGGPGTVPTIDHFVEGGDELFFVDARYEIPVDLVKVPFVGVPMITLRQILGGAGIGRFPTLHQTSGVRLALGPLYGDFLIDPVTRHTHNGIGMSLSR